MKMLVGIPTLTRFN